MAERRIGSTSDGTDRRGPTSVLIVNDDERCRELLVRFLSQAGFITFGSSGGPDTMLHMAAHLPRSVVLDMQDGGVGSSLQILDQIRTHEDRRINTSRVVLCAQSSKNRTFSFHSGADAFVVRPFHLNDLIDHIDDVIGRSQDDRARHRRDQLAEHP